MAHVKISLEFYKLESKLHPHLFLTLAYLKFFESSIFQKIKNKEFAVEDLASIINSIVRRVYKIEGLEMSLKFLLLDFIFSYTKFIGKSIKSLFSVDELGIYKIQINLAIEMDSPSIKNYIDFFSNNDKGGNDGVLSKILKNIELSENFS